MLSIKSSKVQIVGKMNSKISTDPVKTMKMTSSSRKKLMSITTYSDPTKSNAMFNVYNHI